MNILNSTYKNNNIEVAHDTNLELEKCVTHVLFCIMGSKKKDLIASLEQQRFAIFEAKGEMAPPLSLTI